MAAPSPAPRHPARPGDEVAAVPDDDRVIAEAGEQLAVDAGRVDGIAVRCQRVGIGDEGGMRRRAHGAAPVAPIAGTSDEFAQGDEYVREVPRRTPGQFSVGRQLGWAVGDVDDVGRRRGRAERAVSEPEVERGSDDDRQVALAKGSAPRPRRAARVATRYDPAPHPIGDRGQVQFFDQFQHGPLGAVGPHISADNDDRALGGPDQRRDLIQIADLPPGPRGRRLGCGTGGAEEHVDSGLHEDRAAVGGARLLEGRGGDLADPLPLTHGMRRLGDGRKDGCLIEFLQRSPAPRELRRPTAEED